LPRRRPSSIVAPLGRLVSSRLSRRSHPDCRAITVIPSRRLPPSCWGRGARGARYRRRCLRSSDCTPYPLQQRRRRRTCERRMAVNFTRPAGAVRNCFGGPAPHAPIRLRFRFNGGAWVDEAEQNRWQTATLMPPGKLSFPNGIDGPRNISRRATRRVAMMKRGSSATYRKFVRSSCLLVASIPGSLCVDG